MESNLMLVNTEISTEYILRYCFANNLNILLFY